MQLQQHRDEIERLGLRVAAVTFETPGRARTYVEETQLCWPLLVDTTRSLYHAYGMQRGGFRTIWGIRNWGAYLRLMARGQMPRRPYDDVNQLGGDVLLNPEGVVRLHHISRGPADRPSIDSLLALVGEARNARPA